MPLVFRVIVTICAVVGFLNLAPKVFFMPFAAIAHMVPEVRFAKAFWSKLLTDRDFSAAYETTSSSFRESHTKDEFTKFLKKHMDQTGWDASLALADHSSGSSAQYSSEGPTTRSSTAMVGTRLTGSNSVSVAYIWLNKVAKDFRITRVDIVTGAVIADSLSEETPVKHAPHAPVAFVFQPTNSTWRILPRKKEEPF